MILDAGRLDHLFGIFERAAVAGRRCPTADELPSCSQALARELARQGRIRIEISGRNWRQIFILTGPMAGKSTAPNPDGHRIWRIIGRDDRVNGCIFGYSSNEVETAQNEPAANSRSKVARSMRP